MKRQITDFATHIWEHLETFYRNSTNDGWMSFWGALIGAVISAGAALWVVDRQFQQQKNKDEEQQMSNETNKLKYLHFLIEDSFKSVKYYAIGTEKLRKSFQANPFTIPAFDTYPAHSLYAIANKINQEEGDG